jgi:hypothetical protein
MMKHLGTMVLAAGIMSAYVSSAFAAPSQDECAIWLCLPGGFPEGCSGAHRAFTKRIRKGKPPLPDFSSCSSRGIGSYQMGYDQLEDCRTGYVQKDNWIGNNQYIKNACVSESCYQPFNINAARCEAYHQQQRVKPHYVDMWTEGEYIGRFWW